jgi:hypothetical protein
MCLERIANGAPRFLVHTAGIIPQTQVNEAFVFSDSVRNCKKLPVADINVEVLGQKVLPQAFQTTVSAQPIRDNKIVNITIDKLGRSLIASKDLYQSTCPSTRKLTADQLDLETRPRIGAKHTAVIFIHF